MGYLLTKVKYMYSTRKKSTGKYQTGPRHIYSSQSPFLVTQFMVCHQIVNHYMMGRETVPRSSVLLSSVTQSCLILCDPMDCSMPGLPIHCQLPEFTQTHAHWVGDAIQLSHPLFSPSPLALNLSQHQGLFQWVSSQHQVAKVLVSQLQHQSFQWIPRIDLL